MDMTPKSWLKNGAGLLVLSLVANILSAVTLPTNLASKVNRTWLVSLNWVERVSLFVGLMFIAACLASAVWDAHTDRA